MDFLQLESGIPTDLHEESVALSHLNTRATGTGVFVAGKPAPTNEERRALFAELITRSDAARKACESRHPALSADVVAASRVVAEAQRALLAAQHREQVNLGIAGTFNGYTINARRELCAIAGAEVEAAAWEHDRYLSARQFPPVGV